MVKSQKQLITKAKHTELEARLEELKTIKRREIAERLENARAMGDLSENAEYHDARDAQADIEDEIAGLEQILREAEIVKSHTTHEVTVGAKVALVKSGTRTEVEYEIVGSAEANAATRKLSSDSPLGRALLGAKVGETVALKAPTGTIKYKVKKIV